MCPLSQTLFVFDSSSSVRGWLRAVQHRVEKIYDGAPNVLFNPSGCSQPVINNISNGGLVGQRRTVTIPDGVKAVHLHERILGKLHPYGEDSA